MRENTPTLRRLAVAALWAVVSIVTAASCIAPQPPTPVDARVQELAGYNAQALPTRSYQHADGSVETVVDLQALQALIAMAPSRSCGPQCDGKDPATYLVRVPGDAYYCAADAVTVKRYATDYSYVELRYSPLCRTAWTRGCCYTAFAGFGYHRNGAFRTWVHNYNRYSRFPVWTAMLDDAGLLYKACMDQQVGGPSKWGCTGLY